MRGSNPNRPFPHLRIPAALLICLECLWLALYSSAAPRIVVFVAVSLLASTAFIAIWVWIKTRTPGQKSVGPLAIIAIGLVFRATLLFVEPTASDDVYRYLWDGRVQANGINPYRYAPADSALAGLSTTDLPSRVNFPEMKTIYPPVAEAIFLASSILGGTSLLTLKLLLLLSEALTLFILLALLRELRLPEPQLALYAFCPLPILHFMIDAHVDGFAIPFLLLGILLWNRRSYAPAGVALAGGIATKILPVIALPALVATARGHRRLFGSLLPLGIAACLYLPYMINGGDPFAPILTFSANWEANSSLFRIIMAAVNNNQSAHFISMALIGLWILFIASRPWSLIARLYWTFLGFFLLASTVHPWYLAWLAVLLPLFPRWSGIAYVALGNLAGFTIIRYVQEGVWLQPLWALLLEYIPVFLLAAVELKRDCCAASSVAEAL